MSQEAYVVYNTPEEMQKAYADYSNDLISCNPITKNIASYNDMRYIDIEPSRSVKPMFSRDDYGYFRPNEAIPTKQKKIIKMCMDSYDSCGIISNIIDLMGEFACQGMTIVHPKETEERFYRRWFTQISGEERSERFLNYLYRTGNVIISRKTAKITLKKETDLKKVTGADVEVENMEFGRREIPWQYEYLDPLLVDYDKNGKLYRVIPKDLMKKDIVSNDIYGAAQKEYLDVNKTLLFYYKKDDWATWANPMIYKILRDIVMLEKMKLCDLAALDGVISNVRLWTLGDFEYKIMPKKPAFDKLRDTLASHTGGGPMDLIWGPELKFTETSSEIYKVLGEEKYIPVLNAIYGGLGVPPSLTGINSSGGFTNNFVSLKTLIERLEYGRKILLDFWNHEFSLVQKAMRFTYPAQIHFDSIILSDEAAEKTLLVALADRDIISHETLLERFGEIPSIERIRTKRENKKRANNPSMPQKAGPYHDPQTKEELVKGAQSNQTLNAKEYYKKFDIPYQAPPKPVVKTGVGTKKKPSAPNGRPKSKQDTGKRKQKRVLPRSKAIIWANNIQKSISDILIPFTLAHFNKKNIRSLTKSEYDKFEYLKLCVLSGLEPFSDVNNEIVAKLVATNSPSPEFINNVNKNVTEFIQILDTQPTTEDMKSIYAISYAEMSENENI